MAQIAAPADSDVGSWSIRKLTSHFSSPEGSVLLGFMSTIKRR
jgi:hypothetical protein